MIKAPPRLQTDLMLIQTTSRHPHSLHAQDSQATSAVQATTRMSMQRDICYQTANLVPSQQPALLRSQHLLASKMNIRQAQTLNVVLWMRRLEV
mmetsp:Transcript_15444/g.29789  ORF Transcript_15444/g.29789 Transcript_15444/m.29789 type:complete len:94 (+) Transcript_15444:600-881(+)